MKSSLFFDYNTSTEILAICLLESAESSRIGLVQTKQAVTLLGCAQPSTCFSLVKPLGNCVHFLA